MEHPARLTATKVVERRYSPTVIEAGVLLAVMRHAREHPAGGLEVTVDELHLDQILNGVPLEPHDYKRRAPHSA